MEVLYQIDNQVLWTVHTALMIIGLIAFISGTIIALLLKEKKWWLKAHHLMDVNGFTLIFIALIITIYLLSIIGNGDLMIYISIEIINVSLYIVGFMIGPGLFKKLLANNPKISVIHRWLSRGNNTLLIIVIILGFTIVSLV